jgi:ATP-dependent HslUV protease subunit HslV
MACVNLVKAWRTEKILRRLNAQLIVADKNKTLLVSGGGDVVEPEDGIIAIGSGGLYALSAAKALADVEGIDAEEIARKSMYTLFVVLANVYKENRWRFVRVH